MVGQSGAGTGGAGEPYPAVWARWMLFLSEWGTAAQENFSEADPTCFLFPVTITYRLPIVA